MRSPPGSETYPSPDQQPKASLDDRRCLQLHITMKLLHTQQATKEERLLGLGKKHGASPLPIATRL